MQAVKHLCADLPVHAGTARAAVYAASVTADIAAARLLADAAAARGARDRIQGHSVRVSPGKRTCTCT
ncbi:hypothetical protein [Streptomyces sp. NPDC048521]|uniref:hypothetical protein n=1 Tax=Streptomyces sp. NPDC048521 TaxID=3365566 RepID=UPI00371E1A08